MEMKDLNERKAKNEGYYWPTEDEIKEGVNRYTLDLCDKHGNRTLDEVSSYFDDRAEAEKEAREWANEAGYDVCMTVLTYAWEPESRDDDGRPFDEWYVLSSDMEKDDLEFIEPEKQFDKRVDE